MVDSKTMYQHFQPDEHPFIEKMTDLIRRVDNNYVLERTDFLNPREVDILKNLVAKTPLQCHVSTDLYPSEYGRVIIAPEYYELDVADFDMSLIEISYNPKFNRLTHAQILGTLLNELGIKRSLLGDIFTQEGYAQIMISKALLGYFLGNISKIARASVKLKEVDFDQLIGPSHHEITVDILASSLRIDRLIATALSLSRNQAIKLIESDNVKANYRVVNKISYVLELGDMVSIRGYGRFRILAQNGITKNGKYKVTLGKMMHK
ncbi:YlmH family RNA-binding protein [Streptococcus phocae subsp. salmonis]|uniref:YlmH family RNA-binding protein n=1 Tax=Streptococcus phocae TaxID=119224 RepID=UPI0005319A23|nr:RNA-binding protein [Streptococcus phocae]KGR72244.1 RNA-binding protein [Streptococcus phocae subsp. salmonis]